MPIYLSTKNSSASHFRVRTQQLRNAALHYILQVWVSDIEPVRERQASNVYSVFSEVAADKRNSKSSRLEIPLFNQVNEHNRLPTSTNVTNKTNNKFK